MLLRLMEIRSCDVGTFRVLHFINPLIYYCQTLAVWRVLLCFPVLKNLTMK